MSTSLYLINPACDVPTYHSGDVFAASGMAAATSVADLATTTVAAMAPEDVHVAICDEDIEPADLSTSADIVGLTGKVTQLGRMIALAAKYRARGKTVLIGGSYASLDPEALRPHCDILVRGELEDIAGGLFNDLKERRVEGGLRGGRPALTSSPIPRWDLYRNDRALLGCVQTSRGCPYQCEFCDVIEYLGRKQRFKGVGQVLAELDVLKASGYRRILISDDNFTVGPEAGQRASLGARRLEPPRSGYRRLPVHDTGVDRGGRGRGADPDVHRRRPELRLHRHRDAQRGEPPRDQEDPEPAQQPQSNRSTCSFATGLPSAPG